MDCVSRARDLNSRYGGHDGMALLSALIHDEFAGKITLVSSFGAESAILLFMVSKIDPNLPVTFLETGKLFPETLEYRDTLVARLGLTNIKTFHPDYTDVRRYDPEGTLSNSDTNACCYIRKVKPLQKALKGFDAWITGRKRFHGGTRGMLDVIEAAEGKIKVNPLALWSAEQLAALFTENDLPPHPLAAQGYTSIGCMPCTQKPLDPSDPRSGRWAGSDKTECGIHLGPDGKFQRGG